MPATNSEFGLIEKIASRFADLTPAGIEGIGDDCAILCDEGRGTWESELELDKHTSFPPQVPSPKSLVMTADMLIEDVHFTRLMPPFDLGVRSVEVNVSDVAAMGAKPVGLLLSIALPDWVDEQWTDKFFEGIHSCGVALIGGDTTRSRGGLCINITAIGKAPLANIKRRSAARVGDRIMVAGELGASATSNYTIPVYAQRDEGVWFGTREEIGAMMDLSDGLAGDLPHILRASEVGAVVELNDLPIADGATIEQALGGGEDYKLLLTVRAEAAEQLQRDFQSRFGTPLYNIGEIVADQHLTYTRGGDPTPLDISGFRHF